MIKEKEIIMDLNYSEIGARIARRRRQLGMKQFEVEEKADISYKYLSNIERGISIPSLEVLMRLAEVLKTTPDEFLLEPPANEEWKNTAKLLRDFDEKQLFLAKLFLHGFQAKNLNNPELFFSFIYRIFGFMSFMLKISLVLLFFF